MTGTGTEYVDHPTPASRKRRRWLGLFAGLLVGVLIVGLVWAILTMYSVLDAVRNTQTDNSPVLTATAAAAKDAKKAADTIQDCVKPGGKCYERGQRQTAKAVGDISQLNVYGQACAIAEAQRPDAATVTPQVLAGRLSACITELAEQAQGPGSRTR